MLEMNPYLEVLRPKLSQLDYQKLGSMANPNVHQFIAKASDLCHPDRIFICSDSAEDIANVRRQAVATGEEKAVLTLHGHTVHFDGEHDQGRDRQATKYLVPRGFSLSKALNQIDRQEGLAEGRGFLSDFLRVLHSAGKLDDEMVSVEHEKKRIYIDNMDNTIYSVNTQYAGNSVGFKKLAFRLAIRKASYEGWLAEHMLLMGVQGPNGRKTYFAGAFPSACGKTSTAMLSGETILGDDIAYIRSIDSVARAVNV